MNQDQWANQLKAKKAERRVQGVSGVDARLAAVNAAKPEDEEGGFDEGELAPSIDLSPQDRMAQLAEARRAALRQQAAAFEAEQQQAQTEAAEQEQAQASQSQMAQVAGQAGQAAEAAAKQGTKMIVRKWPSAIVPTFGLIILVMDIVYALRWLFPTSWPFKLVPKPRIWEVIALLVITALAAISTVMQFAVIMAIPATIVGLVHSFLNLF